MYAVDAAIVMGNASRALDAMCRAIDGGETEIGLAAAAHSDSSAVAVLLAAMRHGQATGKVVRFSDLPASMRSLATLYGVEGLVEPERTAAPG